MEQTVTQPTFQVCLDSLPVSKFERERRAFQRLRRGLLATHRGQYVAIHEEQVTDSSPVRLDLALRVLQRIGNVDIYVGLVDDQPQSAERSGVRRYVRALGRWA